MSETLRAIEAPQHGLFGDDERPTATLADRFVVPPFSVLDARAGYWQERKRAWLGLGIKSELGRGEGLTLGNSPQVTEAGLNYYRNRGGPRPHGRDNRPVGESGQGRYTGGDCWRAGGSAKAFNTQGNIAGEQTGTSIFDPVLCEIAYRWFCPPRGTVLDPFAGGSVRGIVASHLSRAYVGIELRGEQVEANRVQAQEIAGFPCPVWHTGDSRECGALLGRDFAADFLFTCPPYADLEVYSDDPRDLSTMPYPEFLAAFRCIVAAGVRHLRPNRFACVVVGEVRDKRGLYYGFVNDTVQAFRDAGAAFYNEGILVTVAGSLPVRAGKQFTASRKLGKTHQNVLVFVKGDPRAAAAACGEAPPPDPEVVADVPADFPVEVFADTEQGALL